MALNKKIFVTLNAYFDAPSFARKVFGMIFVRKKLVNNHIII